MSTQVLRQMPRTPQALAEAHPCPVLDCTIPVSPGHVACRTHWVGVPAHQRRVLVEAFRRREQDPYLYRQAVRRARQLVIARAADAGHAS